MKRSIPKFQSPEEAALFWEKHEILNYVDPDEFKVVHPRKKRRYTFLNPLKRSKKQLISLRVESKLLQRAKSLAVRRQVGYQVVLRKWLEKGALPG